MAKRIAQFRHNVDITVVEIETYFEEQTIFVQPNVIIPLPVSKFAETGKAPAGDVSRPWLEDGKKWHLEKRCSPSTKELLNRINEVIQENFDVDGPSWDQKDYVAYRVGNSIWLLINTGATTLRLRFNVKTGTFNQAQLSQQLGLREFDTEDTWSEKFGLPSSVQVKNRNETMDRIIVRVKEDFNWESDAFLNFLQKAYEAFPR